MARSVGRPRKSNPVDAVERAAIEERRSSQFDELLAKKGLVPTARVKPPKPAGGILPVEGDEDRAGVVARPETPARRPVGKTPKPKKRVKHRSRVRLDPVDLEAAMVSPWRLRAAAEAARARRTPRPDGWTRIDQFLASWAAAQPDQDVWMTAPEIVRVMDGIIPRDDVNWLISNGRRKGAVERLAVTDPIAARVDLTPGRVIPKALYRLTRAGRALVMALG